MNRNGFTLIELLVSAGIFGLLITAMTVMLLEQQRQFNFTKELADIDTTGRAIIDLIASDIRNSGARQGKAFSVSFTNGGGTSCAPQAGPAVFGTLNSPPDCLNVYTWNLTSGFEPGQLAPTSGFRLPLLPLSLISKSESSLSFSNNANTSLTINLPATWFENEKGSSRNIFKPDPLRVNGDNILIGFRSRQRMCNPNPAVFADCEANPGRCAECSVILRATLNTNAETATITQSSDVLEHNFPRNLFPEQIADIEQFIVGVPDPSNRIVYGFIPTFSLAASEYSYVRQRRFSVDIANRSLNMIQNQGNPQPIAGGAVPGNPQILNAVGVVDLQFVFNIQNPDGIMTRVGACTFPDETSDGTCDKGRLFNNFDQRSDRTLVAGFFPPAGLGLTCCFGREQDIRSVDITLVLKSKIKPVQIKSGFYQSRIPPYADVAGKRAPKDIGDRGRQAGFNNEPQEGFIYRVFTTTVHLRNLTREEQYEI